MVQLNVFWVALVAYFIGFIIGIGIGIKSKLDK